MSSMEIAEWRVFFQLEAADMEAAKHGGVGGAGGSVEVVTLSGRQRVE